MRIVQADAARRDDWAALHAEMFPDDDASVHLDNFVSGNGAAFLAVDESGTAQGYAEVSVRHDYVNGLDTSPAAFLEAVYVRPTFRRAGAARALVAAVEAWSSARGLRELGSDALLDNAASHAMHIGLGFEETERIVCFRRVLGGEG